MEPIFRKQRRTRVRLKAFSKFKSLQNDLRGKSTKVNTKSQGKKTRSIVQLSENDRQSLHLESLKDNKRKKNVRTNSKELKKYNQKKKSLKEIK